MKATIKETRFGLLEKEFTLDTEKEDPKHNNIFNSLEEAMYHEGYGFGCDLTVLTMEQIDKIKNGGVLVFDDGEYVHYVVVE